MDNLLFRNNLTIQLPEQLLIMSWKLGYEVDATVARIFNY